MTQTAPGGNATPLEEDAFAHTRMSFGDHIEELRARILRGIIGLVIACVLSMAMARHILVFIAKPLLVVQQAAGQQPELLTLSPTSGFMAYIKLGLLAGLVISMPWILHQIYLFVAAGLYPREQAFVRRLAPVTAGLFVIGVLFLYFIVLPVVLHFFVRFNLSFSPPELHPTALQRALIGAAEDTPIDTANLDAAPAIPILTTPPEDPADGQMWFDAGRSRLCVKTTQGVLSVALDRTSERSVMRSQFAIDHYVSFILMLALAFGIAFETPLVVVLLVHTGIVSVEAMSRQRRYVVLGIVITAALLTPPDIVSQLLLAGPMYALFEAGLLVARRVNRTAPADQPA